MAKGLDFYAYLSEELNAYVGIIRGEDVCI